MAVVPLSAPTRLLADLDGGERRYLPIVRDGSALAAVTYPEAPPLWREVRPGPPAALERVSVAGERYLAFTSAPGCGFRPCRSAIPADADHPFRPRRSPGA